MTQLATITIPQWLAKSLLANLEEIGEQRGPLNWYDSAVQGAAINARSLREWVERGEAAFQDYVAEMVVTG